MPHELARGYEVQRTRRDAVPSERSSDSESWLSLRWTMLPIEAERCSRDMKEPELPAVRGEVAPGLGEVLSCVDIATNTPDRRPPASTDMRKRTCRAFDAHERRQMPRSAAGWARKQWRGCTLREWPRPVRDVRRAREEDNEGPLHAGARGSCLGRRTAWPSSSALRCRLVRPVFWTWSRGWIGAPPLPLSCFTTALSLAVNNRPCITNRNSPGSIRTICKG